MWKAGCQGMVSSESCICLLRQEKSVVWAWCGRSLVRFLGRSHGVGNGNPLQYSCLRNPMEREPGGLQSMGSKRVRCNWEHTPYNPEILLGTYTKKRKRERERERRKRKKRSMSTQNVYNSQKVETTKMSTNKWMGGKSTQWNSPQPQKEVLICITTWMNLENIMPSERNQTQKTTHGVRPFVCNMQIKQIQGDRCRWVVVRDRKEKGLESED